MKILKTGDNLNSMAQKIRNLGIGSQDVTDGAASSIPLGARQELLQRRIFSTSSGFLKEHILSLPKLPTFHELKETQERRRFVGHFWRFNCLWFVYRIECTKGIVIRKSTR